MNVIDNIMDKLKSDNTAPSSKPVVLPIGVSTKKEVSQANGSSEPVHIDLDRLKAAGIVTPDSMASVTSEQIRHIKRPLLNMALRKNAATPENSNLIMVTSARPDEGKTFFAANLAMSIAMERDYTVLLVDGDAFNTSLSHLFNIETNAGLNDCLIKPDVHIDDVLIKTDIPRLSFLPSGRHHLHVTELMASENMKRIMRELCQRYHDRIIIFDSPPILSTSLTSVLASYMGQIVVIVEEGETLQEDLNEALALLDTKKSSVGLVMNKSRKAVTSDYYYRG